MKPFTHEFCLQSFQNIISLRQKFWINTTSSSKLTCMRSEWSPRRKTSGHVTETIDETVECDSGDQILGKNRSKSVLVTIFWDENSIRLMQSPENWPMESLIIHVCYILSVVKKHND